ncbi:MAG: type II CRISPR RNA-guided endonuclease Cas9 [Gammaproteobacteria bacterium]|nr:type II CRISPR RNA-guided endonuclease Cas9 [Gammaproteobacteria bacterium]MDH5653855.1 type II CRISPR RNA-guided endonuclease Cas9 [Gammaproteobacteria bacterium]
MRYRLALDLGVSSIGWCLIRLNAKERPVAIIRMGTRIFPDGRKPKDGTSLAVERRNLRQMRRRRDRLLKRKSRMMSALIRLDFFPKDEKQRRELLKLDPYVLRKKGLYEPLSGPEFARALFHINQRRGFKSNRKTDKNSNDKEKGVANKAIQDLHEKLKQEDCQTLGEWLANRHARRESVRARLRIEEKDEGEKIKKIKRYDFYVDRAMVEHEFDVLWKKQHSYNPTLYNDAARAELRDELLFQRELKPVKPGRCTLLPDEVRAPLALPSAQRVRIYQEVNNLRILNEDLTEKPPLTLEQRNQIINLLEHQKEVTFVQIRKELGLSGVTQFNLEDQKRNKLKGNLTNAVLAKKGVFGKQWYEFNDNLQETIVEKLLDEENLSELVIWLQENTGVDESMAEKIADTGLPEGYSRLSSAALRRLLPELSQDVLVYSEAVKRAGLGSHSALSHTERTGELMDELPYYGIPLQRHVAFPKENPRNDEERYGKIANPTVHIGLNELRKVVNGLIKRYGHPSEVIIEVARELKLSKKKKEQLQKEQAERQKLNEKHVKEACKVLGLNPDHIEHNKRRELSQKMQLWVELNSDITNRKCPYTGEQIAIHRLLTPEVEIEHILPYSRTLDDSMNNKTISLHRANRDKGNLTPHEAFAQHPDYNYEAILERANYMPKAKARRFSPDGYDYWLKNEKDFLARALNDTAYLSRIAGEYLTLICPKENVHVIPGRMTALLRGKFGFKKNRHDHRHHAQDASIIGISDRSLLQRLATASASAREKQLEKLIETIPLPWPCFQRQVERALKNVIVSHKPDHSFEGSMFKETAYGVNADGSVKQKKNSDDKKERTISYVIPISDAHQNDRHGVTETGDSRPYKAYAPDGNYCLEIIETESGIWQMETIPVFKAYQIARTFDSGKYDQTEVVKKIIQTKLSTIPGKLVMKLIPGDVICIDYKGVKNRLLYVVKMSVQGGATFTDINEANISARYDARRKARNKINKEGIPYEQLESQEQFAFNDEFLYSLIGVNDLKAGKARKVTISPIGDLNDFGFKGSRK